MALGKCPECGGQVSTDAAACPHCGKVFKKPQAKGSGCGKLIFAGVLFLVLGTLLMQWKENGESSRSSAPSASDIDRDACLVAQRAVRARLKAPSTAKFEYCGSDSNTISHNPQGDYLVVGPVDSQNSFGAMLRSRYAVSLHHEGGDRFTVKSVDLLE